MNYAQCIDPECKTPNPLVCHAGQNPHYPWLISYACQMSSCKQFWFVCNGSCGLSRPKIMTEYSQVNRHHKHSHYRKTPGPTFEERQNIVINSIAENLSKTPDPHSFDDFPIDLEDSSSDFFSQPYIAPTLSIKEVFKMHMVSGNSLLAAATLVSSASLQTKNLQTISVAYGNVVLSLPW
jgi:hypothetical protein